MSNIWYRYEAHAMVCIHLHMQDEKALYDAATRGDMSTVRQLIASHVNVDCTPYGVCVTIVQVVCFVMGCKREPFVDVGEYE